MFEYFKELPERSANIYLYIDCIEIAKFCCNSRTGKIPTEWNCSTFITLSKNNNASYCADFRLISLKIFLKILMKRLKGLIHPLISDAHYGFMPDRGTRNEVLVFKILLERSLQMQKDFFLCFVDY